MIFRKKAALLNAAVEVTSDAIRVLVFEVVAGRDGTGPAPRIIKKLVFPISSVARSPLRVATKVREALFTTVTEIGAVPPHIMIAVGPELAQESLVTWPIRLASPITYISRGSAASYFTTLLEQHAHEAEAFFVYPIDILINGYSASLVPAVSSHMHRVSPEKGIALPHGVRDISFRAVRSLFDPEVGRVLADARKGLGGLPIDFVPTPVVVAEAACREAGVGQMLLIDVGRMNTTITLTNNCSIREIVSFASGYEQWVKAVAKQYGGNAENLLSQYASGVVNAAERSMISSVLSKEIEQWGVLLREALDGMYPLGPLPADIRLYGIGAALPEVGEWIRRAQIVARLSATSSSTVRILTAENIFSGATLGGAVSGSAEVGIASLVYYSLNHCPVVSP